MNPTSPLAFQQQSMPLPLIPGSGQGPQIAPQGSPQQPQKPKRPQGEQITLPIAEQLRLIARIDDDKRNAMSAHSARMAKFARYERFWRARVGMPGGEEGKSNFHVPLIKWQIFGKLAKETESLLGDDAQVVAIPVGPTDSKATAKVGCYMTWQVFQAMKITKPLAIFCFRKLLNGRAFAYAPYRQLKYNHPTKGRVTYSEGPAFEPIDPDDLIVPAEDALSIQDFSFVIRRYLASPAELLLGEEDEQIYQGVSDNWGKILQSAKNNQQRDNESDVVKLERDESEAVQKQNVLSNRECLQVEEWYGRWRMLEDPAEESTDPREATESEPPPEPAQPGENPPEGSDGYMYNGESTADDIQPPSADPIVAGEPITTEFAGRDRHETDLLVRYLPELRLIIGVQKLDEIYPDTPHKRPIVEACLVNDGSYWCPSLPELLEDAEAELTVNHNMATEAGQMTVGPLVFYRPASGVNPDVLRYEPNMAIPCDNPKEDVYVVQISPNMQYSQVQQQNLLGIVERLTGISDATLGRTSDRPNQPRTARGQMLLSQAGDVRISLDTRMLREDFAEIVMWFWELCTMFAPEEQFFRVTEEDANGQFETSDGFGKITAQERGGRFDFKLQLATTLHSRESAKEELIELMGVAMQSPLISQNASAQYRMLVDLFKAFGRDFTRYTDQPAPPFAPLDPQQEWTLLLEGEAVHVNPMDNDEAHIADHQARVMKMHAAPVDSQDQDAMYEMIDHIMEHKAAMLQKRQAQQVFGALMGAMGQRGGEPGQPGQPGAEQGQGSPDMGGLLQAAGGEAGGAPQVQGGLSALPPGQQPSPGVEG